MALHGTGAASVCMLGAQVVSSAIVDKYIGESARLIREMFAYAKVRLHPVMNLYVQSLD